MKKIFALFCIIFVLGLCGCDAISDDTFNPMFVLVEHNTFYNYRIVYHKDTKVMYAVSSGNNNSGTFTLLVNPDGTPMVYEE